MVTDEELLAEIKKLLSLIKKSRKPTKKLKDCIAELVLIFTKDSWKRTIKILEDVKKELT